MTASEFLLLGVLSILFSGLQTVPIMNIRTQYSQNIEEEVEDDDFTTHTLERLSSAATCLVAGVEYTHGQQIFREDPCEFCLCLDGEMFCWWQDCPPAVQVPCNKQDPFSTCSVNEVKGGTSSPPPVHPSKPANSGSTIQSTLQEILSSSQMSAINTFHTPSAVSTDATSFEDEDSTAEETTETTSTASGDTTTSTPKRCIVMDREYEIGAKLPHDTGNCIECFCGAGAKVTCSPNQCAPAGEDIEDYRPPRSRQPQQEVFK